MAASNLIIHLGALLAFIAMALALLRVQKQREFMRRGLPPRGVKLPQLDWQLAYLQKFAAAYNLPFSYECTAKTPLPIALDPCILPKFCYTCGIISLRFYRPHSTSEEFALEIVTSDPEGLQPHWHENLSRGLGLSLSISLVQQFPK
jgi:hypothetical protein